MLTKQFRFGGPGLPEGTHTWYETPAGAMHTAYPGTVVDADQVVNLEMYESRGMGSRVVAPVESAPRKKER